MARLVVRDNITSVGALAVSQTLRLGGFIMTARSAAVPTMTSRLIKKNLHISLEYAEQMDPMELSSLNGLWVASPLWELLRTTIGLGLNLIREGLNLRRSPIK